MTEPARGTGSGVTVVIPTFNRVDDLQRALEHVYRQTASGVHVVVVDNSSTDHTPKMIASLADTWGERLRYVRREPNGPASARNTGLAITTTPFVMFLDSDVDLAANWIESALRHLERARDLGAIGGYLIYAFDRMGVNAYGGDLGRMGLAWDVGEGSTLDVARGSEQRIWVNCSAMLARADAVRTAGAFDETFFYGYEDSDLGWRLNIVGYRVAVFPDLVAVHNVGDNAAAAHPEIVFHYCKNRLRSILKNASAGSLALMLGGYLSYVSADLIARGPRAPKLRALAWNFARLRETFSLRKLVQQQRKVDDASIFASGSKRWLPPTALGGRRRRPARQTPRARDQTGTAKAFDDRI